jgi:hypothetical protein
LRTVGVTAMDISFLPDADALEPRRRPIRQNR